MLENDVEELGFTFEAETQGDFGELMVTELKPNGSYIAVTNANKSEYEHEHKHDPDTRQSMEHTTMEHKVKYKVWNILWNIK